MSTVVVTASCSQRVSEPSTKASEPRPTKERAMPQAFDYFSLTEDIRLHLLSFFDVRDLITFACTSKQLYNLLLQSNLPGVVALFRNLVLLEVGDDLPLAQVDIAAMDWRRAIKHWQAMIFNWVPVSVDKSDAAWKELPARYLHRVAMVGHTAYLFGGMGPGERLLNDVWSIDVDQEAVIRYKEVMPLAGPPSPLPRFAASFNAVSVQPEGGSKRDPVTLLCLFGGSTQANDFLDDTTLLDPLARVWEPVIAVGEPQDTVIRPKMRWGHATVTFKNHVVLFGGSKPGEAFNDLWILEPQTRVWTEIKCKTPESPCPCKRGGHSGTVVQQRFLYVFGGNTLQDSFNDTWRIDLHECLAQGAADWERVDTTGETPSMRIGHTSLGVGPRLLIQGGRNFLNNCYIDDFCVLDTRTNVWTRVDIGGRPLLPRTGHSLIPHARGLVMFGGLSTGNRGLGDFGMISFFGTGPVLEPLSEDEQPFNDDDDEYDTEEEGEEDDA